MPLPEGRKPMSPEWFAEQAKDFSSVNRVEVIDNSGRVYVRYNVTEVSYQLQDGCQTLKLFVEFEE